MKELAHYFRKRNERMNFSQIKAMDEQYVAGTYGRFNLAVKSGSGATCEDFEGKKYIDFSSGIGVNSLGFADAEWVAAITGQAAKVAHISNLYYTEPGVHLAKTLCERTGMKKVFFCNSGAEANEGAIKTARKYSKDNYGEERYEIITLNNSFHGRTIATLAATGQEHFHTNFGPFPEGFVYADAYDAEAVKAKINSKTCAVMIEMIQGEGGVVPLDKEFVSKVAQLCRENDLLLIVDEVQTGIGRTGSLCAFMQYNIAPDILTLAKGLGSGLPIGALLFGEKTQKTLGLSDHGTTFGMNPVVCAGANVVLKRIDELFLSSVREKGELLSKALKKCPNVESVAGLGLMIGIKPKKGEPKEIVTKCIERGLIVLTAKDKVRLLPPLVISIEELTAGVDILVKVLEEFDQ
jgi:acetylornithine/N-succinyldiaminopimelate aminotransferase